MPTKSSSSPTLFFKYGLLTIIALIWGSQFMINKVILLDFNPEGLAFFRALFGFLTLCLLVPVSSEKNSPLRLTFVQIFILFLIGFLEATLPFYLIAYGQLYVPSSITSILMASIALFTLIFVVLFIKHEAVSKLKIIGIILGFIGVFILVFPNLNFKSHSFQLFFGELAILGGAFCFSSSLILIKSFCQDLPPIRTARLILFFAVIQLALVSIFHWRPFWHQAPSLLSIFYLLILGVFAAGIVYVLYVILIRRAGATFTGLTNYLVPVVGIFMGVVILGESLRLSSLIATGIILLAMVLCEF